MRRWCEIDTPSQQAEPQLFQLGIWFNTINWLVGPESMHLAAACCQDEATQKGDLSGIELGVS